MTPVSVVIGGVGALLIYCAIKDVDPRKVVTLALSGKSPSTGTAVPRDVDPTGIVAQNPQLAGLPLPGTAFENKSGL